MKLEDFKKVHFIGIGGVGMSALAKILIESGYEISGSDNNDSPMLTVLKNLGARIFVGHNEKNILDESGQPVDAIVSSSAIPDNNPEIVAADKFKIPKLHRSDINAFLLNSKRGIAIAGSHGKTTTTSMIGYVLHNANVDPTIIIGGESTDLGTGAILGKSEWLVSEADESDGTFVKLKPSIAVVTNVEDDHLDHYGSMDKIRDAFKNFIENVNRDNGVAVLCFDSDNLRELSKDIDRKIISYAIDHEADFKARNILTTTKGIIFDVIHHEKFLGKVQLAIHGRHNILNALATIATALEVGVSFKNIVSGLKIFYGAKRRFQTKGSIRNILVVDDYAHHPTEIAATLKAARETKPNRIVCIFQPHRYSRTKLLLKDFGNAFREADLLIVTDIYSAGEEKIPDVSGELIFREVLKTTNQKASYIPDRENIASEIKGQLVPGDLVITMGAGDIFKTGEEILDLLRRERREKIIVVCGGSSTEAEVSRRTGQAIMEALKSKNYNVELLELNPQTFATTIREKNCSIVFNAIHGHYGEDGLLQGTLDMLKIPYTGSGVLASALTMDKITTKRILNAANISTPKFVVYRENDREKDLAAEIQKNFGFPVVIKAAAQGSTIGVMIVEKSGDIDSAIDNAFAFGEEILVEEFIRGRELTVAVLGNADSIEALPVIEITTKTGRYDYESKYTVGLSTHIVPAEISDDITRQVQQLSIDAFKLCKCSGVARVDIMLSENNIPYVLEVNSVPGMTKTSLVPDAARAAGIDFPNLCEKILELAES